MNIKKNNIIFRKCILSNVKKPKNELIKITYIKKENKVYVDLNNEYQGRSIYFDKSLINNNSLNKILKITNKRFLISIDNSEIEKIKKIIP